MRNRRSFMKILLGLFGLMLLSVTIYASLLYSFNIFPLEIFIITTIIAVSGIAVYLYMGELVIIGWIVDFLSEIGMPKTERQIPLEYEELGEVIVVTLRDNIATIGQCLSVQKQLLCLIDEQHCNFILDFSFAGKTSISLRGVLVSLRKAARKKATNLGKTYRPLPLPPGAVFRVFENREQAINEMSKHDGYGWVVLCSVPVGIRAVSDLT